jgi:hypothetical protein
MSSTAKKRILKVKYKPPYWRYREENTRSEASTSSAWWYVSPTGVTTYTAPWTKATAPAVLGEMRSMGDVVTPAFTAKKAAGGIVNSPMNQVIETTYGSDCGWKQSKLVGSTTYYGESTANWCIVGVGAPAHIGGFGIPDSWITEAATKVIAKLDESQLKITTNILKLKQNVALLGNVCQRLTQYINKFAYGSKGSKANVAATAWMEGRYGWRVFIRELEKILDAITRELAEVTRETARASVSGTIGELTVEGTIKAGVGEITCSTTTTATGRVRCGILHQDSVQTWADIVGLRLSDLPYSAWDLLPYSFVVNWFLNVDVLLRTLSATGVKRLAEWTIVETIHTTVRTHGILSPVAPGWTVTRQPVGFESRVTVERTRWPHVRNPGLVVKQSSFGFLEDLRILDTIALITQAATKGRKFK